MKTRDIFQEYETRSRSTLTFIFAIVVTTIWVVIQNFYNWPLLILGRMAPGENFGDAKIILRLSDCAKKIGSEIFHSGTVGGCYNYNYGSILYKSLNVLRISISQVQAVGVIFICGMILIYSLLLSSRFLSAKDKFMASLVFLSPPTSFLLERGNFDSLVIILAYLIAYLIKKQRILFASILISLISLMKFYTFPIFLLAYIRSNNARIKLFVALNAALSFILIVTDLTKIEYGFPSSGFAQFGAPVINGYLRAIGQDHGLIWGYIFGYLSFVLLICITILLRRRWVNFNSFTSRICSGNFENTYTSVFTILFAACYFGGSSWDYRLVILGIAGVSFMSTGQITGQFRTICWVGLVMALWLSCGFGMGIDPAGPIQYLARGGQLLGDFAVAFWLLGLLFNFKNIVHRERANAVQR